jgi:hypothetical protein
MGDLNLSKSQLVGNSQFNSILTSFSFSQIVREGRHECGNILDLIITRYEDESFIGTARIVEGVADHKGILFNISSMRIKKTRTSLASRNFRQFDKDQFAIRLHENVVEPLLHKFAKPRNIWEVKSSVSSDDFLNEINQLLKATLDEVAPVTCRNNTR